MDRFVQIFIYVVIFGNILLTLLWVIGWIAESRRPKRSLKTKLLWRDLFYIAAGLIGLYLRSFVSTFVVFFVTAMLLGLGTLAGELIERATKRRANDAT
jgi:hypothetical protein